MSPAASLEIIQMDELLMAKGLEGNHQVKITGNIQQTILGVLEFSLAERITQKNSENRNVEAGGERPACFSSWTVCYQTNSYHVYS